MKIWKTRGIFVMIGLLLTIFGVITLSVEPSLSQFDEFKHIMYLEAAWTAIAGGIITVLVALFYPEHPQS